MTVVNPKLPRKTREQMIEQILRVGKQWGIPVSREGLEKCSTAGLVKTTDKLDRDGCKLSEAQT